MYTVIHGLMNLQNGVFIYMLTRKMYGQMLRKEDTGKVIMLANTLQGILHVECIDLVTVIPGSLQKDEGLTVDVQVEPLVGSFMLLDTTEDGA